MMQVDAPKTRKVDNFFAEAIFWAAVKHRELCKSGKVGGNFRQSNCRFLGNMKELLKLSSTVV